MKKALIVIDVQKYFLNKKTERIIKKIRDYLVKHSSKYSQIYFTIFKNNPSAPLSQISDWHGCTKSPDTDLCDDLKDFSEGKLYYKNILSAFKVPAIAKSIKRNGISEVHLCGFDTDCCVLATTYDLFDQGIKPVLLEDLTWSTSRENLHSAAVKMIERNVGFLESAEK